MQEVLGSATTHCIQQPVSILCLYEGRHHTLTTELAPLQGAPSSALLLPQTSQALSITGKPLEHQSPC